ncbi:VOC family protein [Schlegelella sp. S2-27]|uniref:VOC family protein n=1 Tax=Caldimonas mangrovi TaxID=2944811 RepID=A0ABT0YN70_9BURK|nr:VOC family protein [Caldimonas mangrovi]MCM5680167.1 VOC family protein [Caldimonas mangrovi]
MKVTLSSIHVDDQNKALRFYTEVLGFLPSQDIPAGEYRWITVKSPEGVGAELSLEPNANPVALAYQQGLFELGVPVNSFEVGDLQAEYRRLKERGVVFTREPAQTGPVWTAVFSDTCGNLIQIHQAT